jgi:hypothetical protein
MHQEGWSLDKKIKVKKMASTKENAFKISRLFYEKHIYTAIDDRLHDLWFAHEFLCDFERGNILGFGVFDDLTEDLQGVVLCWKEKSEIVGHVFFKRKVDGAKACLLCEEEAKKYYKKKKQKITAFVGYISPTNVAIYRMLKKNGYVDRGSQKDRFLLKNGICIQCKKMEKEIKS